MELVLFIGIPACGKSTFYKECFYDTHVRLNMDMLKTRNREKILFNACLESKTKIVLDNTNPSRIERVSIINNAKAHLYNVKGYYFSSKIDESLARNRTRKNPVPDVAIYSIYKKLELPDYAEGYNELFYVYTGNGEFEVKEWTGEI